MWHPLLARSDQDEFLERTSSIQKRNSKPQLLHNEQRSKAPLPRQQLFLWRITSFFRLYEWNFPDLRHELHRTSLSLVERKRSGGMQSLSSLLEFTACLKGCLEEPFKRRVPWSSTAVQNCCCNGSKSALVSFSTLKLIKKLLRTSMTDGRCRDPWV